jgi:hypothetical protein
MSTNQGSSERDPPVALDSLASAQGAGTQDGPELALSTVQQGDPDDDDGEQPETASGVDDIEVQPSEIVGRVGIQEDPTRTWYYAVNFGKKSRKWCTVKQSDLNATQRKTLTGLITAFDKVYRKHVQESGSKRGRKIQSGRLPRNKMPQGSIRPPPGFPAFSFYEDGKVLKCFGHRGFVTPEMGKEQDAIQAAESTEHVDPSLRCFETTGLGETRATQPSQSAPKRTANPNWEYATEKESSGGMRIKDLASGAAKATEGGVTISAQKKAKVLAPPSNQAQASATAAATSETPNVGSPSPSQAPRSIRTNDKRIFDRFYVTAGGDGEPPVRPDAVVNQPTIEVPDVPRISSAVRFVDDPPEDPKNPRHKSRPRIIMRCSRNYIEDPGTGEIRVKVPQTTNEFPENMVFERDGPEVKWHESSFLEVGNLLYLIGWAETNLSGVRQDYRMFVQNGEIFRVVDRTELDRFENTTTRENTKGGPFYGVKDLDKPETDFRDNLEAYDVGLATEKRLRAIGFDERIIACANGRSGGNVIQTFDPNSGETPSVSVMTSKQLDWFWSLHKRRGKALQQAAAVDEEIATASKHILDGYWLPAKTRRDEANGLDFLDYSKVKKRPKAKAVAPSSNAIDILAEDRDRQIQISRRFSRIRVKVSGLPKWLDRSEVQQLVSERGPKFKKKPTVPREVAQNLAEGHPLYLVDYEWSHNVDEDENIGKFTETTTLEQLLKTNWTEESPGQGTTTLEQKLGAYTATKRTLEENTQTPVDVSDDEDGGFIPFKRKEPLAKKHRLSHQSEGEDYSSQRLVSLQAPVASGQNARQEQLLAQAAAGVKETSTLASDDEESEDEDVEEQF